MAKTIAISLRGSSFELIPQKVDRDKLYGHTELRVLNADGTCCSQAAINGDGINIICPGATKIGIIDNSGNWVDKQALIPKAEDGSTPVKIPSSFDNEISLAREASIEELLDLSIQSVYQLTGIDAIKLAAGIDSRIYTFPFSYRGGYECNTAFVLANENGVFMLTGTLTTYEFVGLDEFAELDTSDEDINIEDGELDFSMM
ncbi:MAG: hypothetical protein K2M54_05205 [Muribaculaceae bacterium]|nr:hypothetical protein [Muribaculaceae bacterium]